MSDSYIFDAFGTLLNTSGSTDNDYLYSGEQFDAELDNYYLRARYYDQGVGRFTQMDTFDGWEDDPLSLNKYNYVHSDPINSVDPTGLFSLKQLGTALRINGELAAKSSKFSGSSLVNKALFGTGSRQFG